MALSTSPCLFLSLNLFRQDVSHPELLANFDLEASCETYLPEELTPDQEPTNHGTAVASLAVGGGNNGQCAVGVSAEEFR